MRGLNEDHTCSFHRPRSSARFTADCGNRDSVADGRPGLRRRHDRSGYYEQAQFADEYGSPTCIVKLGCWGPVVQCNVGKRGWMAGIGGCPNVGGICIGCTMPGFPDKFMPFMNQPPGSLLSSSAVSIYGRTVRALRAFTRSSMN